jgi:hypothetical protein
MTIDLIVQSLFLLFNKYRRGQINLINVRLAIKIALYQYYNNELDKYRNGRNDVIPEPIKNYVITQPITLTPNTNGSAFATLPVVAYTGSQQTSSTAFAKGITFTTDYGYEGTIVQQEEFADRMISQILPPTNEFPIAKIQSNSIYVLPAQILRIQLTYFRLPTDFVYAVTNDADGRGFVFNAAGSTDIDINPLYMGEIVKRAAVILGIPYQNPDLGDLPSTK